MLGISLVLAGCTDDAAEPDPKPAKTTKTTAKPASLTFGVYGADRELDAFRSVVEQWNLTSEGPEVEVVAWQDQDRMRAAIESGESDVPDVFLAPRSDLRWLLDNEYTQPVDELLDERGVPFGDGYSRSALQALSADDRLQCMPYAVAPMVIYYNKRLVNFNRMRKRELNAPSPEARSWSFDQFATAAEFATRPGRGTKGVHIAATLSGLGPFIESGGGNVFNDSTDPTSLAFSSDESRGALERTLELLRKPQVTLDEDQLAEATPLQWFKRGKLGMLAGFRSLVPQLRLVPGLKFDVMPMPVLDSSATVGDVTGLCLSRSTANTPAAADFLYHLLSTEAVTQVTRTGYLAPANLEVALGEDFLQPLREPGHAQFFNTSVRAIRFAPLIDTLPEVEEAVRPNLQQLVYGVGVLELDAVTEEIDEASRSVLDPEWEPETPDPSESADE